MARIVRAPSKSVFFFGSASPGDGLGALREALLKLGPLLEFPLHPANPAFRIAGGADQVVLERYFLQAAVAGTPQCRRNRKVHQD